jgi:hypothetical protein
MKIKYEDFVKIISEYILRALQAESEAEFETEYAALVSNAKAGNMDVLEQYFTQNYKHWLEIENS